MKRSKRFVLWIVIVVICFSCVMYFLINNLYYIIIFPKVFERPLLQVTVFGSIVALLIISYRYVINRSANKTRVRLLYTVMGMLAVFTFVFVEYKNHQEKLIIEEVCVQYEAALERRDYETTYKFISPNYRPTSFAQFIASKSNPVPCGFPNKSIRVLLLYPWARKASVINTPFGSLNREIFLEKVDDTWYFTGEDRNFQG